MYLTDYYKYAKSPKLWAGKRTNRTDCVCSTQSYPDFEASQHIYIGTSDHIRAHRHRKADFTVTDRRGKHITSIYPIELKNNGYDYGDNLNNGSADLFLFMSDNFSIAADGKIADGVVIEIFVARGQLRYKNSVNNWLLDGELHAEMENLRAAAVTKSVTE